MPFFSSKNRLLVLLIIFFLLANVRIVLASSGGCAAIGLINPVQALKCMLDEFGINEESLKENSKYLDVANYKKPQPQVTVTFTPTDPTPGEEVIASALPTYFGNHLESLYYTWYLQTAACPPDPNLDGDFKGIYSASETKCNLNGDHKTKDGKNYGIVDIEDYKIKAMRIYAGNDFEITGVDYSKSDGESAYQAIMGGDDQKDKNNSCYFYDTNLGKEYTFQSCFHLFPNAPGYTTGGNDNKFDKGEEYFWHTNPDDPDTAQTGHPDEANVAGLGASDFSWTYQSGDQIGVAVEGVSYDSTIFEDSSYKIMWAIPNNTCGNLGDYIKAPEESTDDYATEISPADWPDCPDGCTFTRTVTKRKTIDKKQSEISSATVTSYKLFTKTETIILPSRRRVTGEGTATGGSTVTAPDGTVTTTGGTSDLAVGTTTLDKFSFDPEEVAICNANDTADLVTNGFFTQAEVDSNEKYQVALDTNKSCCDSSFKADLGNADPETDDYSAACTFEKDPEISITEEITDINSNPEDSLFTMTEDDLNECLLHKNMLTPTEGGGKNEKLEVSLSYSPDNPVNDTSDEGDNADSISVVSTVENPTDSESLNYTWNVYAGDSADSDGEWSDPLLKSQLGKDASGNSVVEQTTGAGIPNLKFKANFGSKTPNSTGGTSTSVPKYLKVKLNVSEKVTGSTADEEGTRKGHAEVIIPLSSFNNKLSFFNTSVDASLTLTQGSEEICETASSSDCQVAPDEIIAVKADIVLETGETWDDDYDFLWTLDDQALSYQYIAKDSEGNFIDNSSAEGFKPDNLIFFPVLAEKGSTLDLSLIATNQTTGAKISLSKSFLVSEPTFEITSSDESTSKPKTLGYYTDLDGKQWPDYSQTEFVALKDSTIKLSVEQLASFPLPSEEDLSLKWYWDNTELSATGRTLSFTAASDIADSFSLSAKGLYKQDDDTKKALNEYWSVSIDEFYERQLSQTIEFTLADSIDGSDSTQKGRGKILASFISSVPAYFAFLFRLVMTAFVLLAAIWILFALFPQTEKND
jgi:hypothetical protein